MKKKIAVSVAITNTMPVVSKTSRRAGQTTLDTSARTWLDKLQRIYGLCHDQFHLVWPERQIRGLAAHFKGGASAT